MTLTKKQLRELNEKYDLVFIRDLAFKLEHSSGAGIAINYLLDVLKMILEDKK